MQFYLEIGKKILKNRLTLSYNLCIIIIVIYMEAYYEYRYK